MDCEKHLYQKMLAIVVLTIVSVIGVPSLYAQNNPYSIHDSLYDIFLKAYPNRYTDFGSRMLDSLDRCAALLGDGKALCLSQSVRSNIACSQGTQSQVERECQKQMQLATHYGFPAYYYHALMLRNEYYASHGLYLLATQTARLIDETATREKNAYGRLCFLKSMGYIHSQIGDFDEALRYMKMALDYSLNNPTGQNISLEYLSLAELYLQVEMYDEVVDCCAHGIKIEHNENNLMPLAGLKLIALYNMGQFADFDREYLQYEKMMIVNRNIDLARGVMAYHEMRLGRTADAQLHADSLSDNQLRYTILCHLYQQLGEGKHAFQVSLKKLENVFVHSMNLTLSQKVNELDATVEQSRLQLERLRLNLERSRMELANAEAGRQLVASQAENTRLQLRNDSMQLHKLKQDRLMLAEEQESNALKQKVVKAIRKKHTLLMGFATIAITVILGIAVILLIYARERMKLIRDKQKQLRQELARAQEMDRMQDSFVHNMSFNVRTPLNSIVGLSEVLLNNGGELTPEDREVIKNNIMSSSDELTTLVNDVLRKALSSSHLQIWIPLCLLSFSSLFWTPVSAAVRFCPDHPADSSFFDIEKNRNLRTEIPAPYVPLYEAAMNKRSETEGVILAQQLYAKADSDQSALGKAFALSVMLHHYTLVNDLEHAVEVAPKMRQMAKQAGEMRLYYLAFTNEVFSYLNNRMSLRAFNLAEDLRLQAIRDQDYLALFYATKVLGPIYTQRYAFLRAIKAYEEALEIVETHHLNYPPTEDMVRLAKLYRLNYQYEKAQYWLGKAEKICATERLQYDILIEEAMLAFERNDAVLFWCIHRQVMDMKEAKGYQYQEKETGLKAAVEIMNGHDEDGFRLIRGTYGTAEEQHARTVCCVRAQQWDKAIESVEKEIEIYRKKRVRVYKRDRDHMDEQLGFNTIEATHMRLRLENNRLHLERNKNQASIAEALDQKLRLDLMRQNMLANRLASQNKIDSLAVAKDKLVMAENYEKDRLTTLLMYAVLVVAFVLLVLLSTYLYTHAKTMKRINAQNEDLARARQLAEESDRQKMAFIQNMSHEIRTPLNAIVGFSQVILDDNNEFTEQERQTFAHTIEHNSELLTQLVEDIISISELVSGQYKMHFAEHRVNELCRVVLDSVRHRVDESQVQLRFESDVPDTLTFVTDSSRLSQVLFNFLTNASKYTTQGYIRLKCSSTENSGRLTLSVEDTGVGIPLDKQGDVFKRFVKLDSFHQGTGLGLHICKIIADRMNALVGIDSNYTQGARFYISVPL